MVNRVKPSSTFCQIWIENERKPVISPVFENKLIWSKNFGHYRDGVYLGYMLGCKVPESAQNASIEAVKTKVLTMASETLVKGGDKKG